MSTIWCFTQVETQEMKALQLQVYIQQWFHDEQGAKFMYSSTFLVWSEITQGMYLFAGCDFICSSRPMRSSCRNES